jgi:hypothetical protein
VVPSSLVWLLRAEQTMAVRLCFRSALRAISHLSRHMGRLRGCTYFTIPAIFSANLPTLVPPNLSTTHPPGKCFSSV